MIGARQGAMTGLRQLVAAAMARDLRAFVVPGADVARAHGLDLAGAGLRLTATPRHAGILLVVGPLPAGLADAASIAYAQMPRPRAILALEAGDPGPLPAADATGPLSQAGLVAALADLRQAIAAGAFRPETEAYDAPALRSRTEFTCPMHPEVVSDEPGNCPKCGMTLVPREAAATSHAGHSAPEKEHPMPAEASPGPATAGQGHSGHAAAESAARYTCPMHPEVVSEKPGSCPKCGMFLVPAEAKDGTAGQGGEHSGHGGHSGQAAGQYTCPMHPEVVSDKPGNCPKCGMFLVPVAAKDGTAGQGGEHSGHGGHGGDGGHSGHGAHSGDGEDGGDPEVEGIEAHFMSMVDMTRDMPKSPDGLKMERITVPFGPFFPGLPGGLRLDLTLDGDAVAEAEAGSAVGGGNRLPEAATAPDAFADRLAALSPLSPVAYRELACRALEAAAGLSVAPDLARARAAAVERERIASHLGWLAGFGAQSGFGWLEARAAALQRRVRAADVAEIAALAAKIGALLRRVRRAPLLRSKLGGIGLLADGDAPPGPAARAAGLAADARAEDPAYAGLGFAVLTGTGGDALARLTQRLGEIAQSLDLIARAGAVALPVPRDIGTASGDGTAQVETPRGAARLRLTLRDGKVTAAEIGAPSAAHVALIGAVAEGRELGDALTAIGSLDISPWEMTA